MYPFPNLEPVCCSMSSSNCCFLTCIQMSYEAGQMVWYSHLFKNFPQFVVIHTVKGFGIVSKTEVDFFFFFLEFSCFFWWSIRCWQFDLWFLCLFLNPAWTFGSSQFTYCWSLTWKILSITLCQSPVQQPGIQPEEMNGVGEPDSLSVFWTACLFQV